MKVTPSGLIIPSSVAEREPPVFYCAVCKEAAFPKSQAGEYQRHVVACAERHEEELRAKSLRANSRGIFGDEGWDVELEQWVRDNKRGIIDGKVRM